MRILVLGIDGYLGWPTAMYLSARGHAVAGLDNYARRSYDLELSTDSLVPIQPMDVRLAAWRKVSGKAIDFYPGSLTDHAVVEGAVQSFNPDAIVHFAEQRSAPYSMMDRRHAVYTQTNNVVGTLNLLYAMKAHAPHAHLIKLGTMGEYGTPNIDIEEGFITITHNGRTDTLPYPKQAGSFYHLSKVHDSHNIMFACRIWGLASTDLNQGVVYGAGTDESELDERLATRFDYDDVFGTALNRFCVEAAVGHPITVYGEGGQTRGFLNIRDTVRCVELAADTPPAPGEYRVFNQFTEQFSVGDLAEMVLQEGQRLGLSVSIQRVANPRVEKEVHYYNAKHSALLQLGLQPHFLSREVITRLIQTTLRFRGRVNHDLLDPRVNWRAVKSPVQIQPLPGLDEPVGAPLSPAGVVR